MELKFIDSVSRTFFSLGILNDEACYAALLKFDGNLMIVG